MHFEPQAAYALRMSYRFDHPDRLAVEIRRVATERLNDALGQLSEGLAGDPAKAVHEARKDLKKTRSLLRLIRANLGEGRFRSENDRLRDAAHLLAGAREADAKVESLEALIEHERSMSAETTLAARGWLAALRTGTSAQADVGKAGAEAAALIARSRDDARLWALGYGSFDLIEPGLRRTFRQGRRYMARAIEDPSDETLHEWRKRVKDMWYSLRLLGEVWEPVIRPMADQAHKLSELLGDHHDLGEVRSAIETGAIELPNTAQTELLLCAGRRQDELHEASISLGRKLYCERPRRYVERLGGLWGAWEEDAARHVGQDGLSGS